MFISLVDSIVHYITFFYSSFCRYLHLNCNPISVKGKMILEHSDITYTLVKISVPGTELFLELLNYDAEFVSQRLSISW